MFNGLKNFAIKKVLRHVADNPRLNKATNCVALIPIIIATLLATDADLMLLIGGFGHPTPAFWLELSKVAGAVLAAIFLWLCGKWRWLASWQAVGDAVIAEAQRELAAAAAAPKPSTK